jgi:hypothetical protein
LPTASSIATPYDAPVAQLDRVSASEAEGRGFESRQARIKQSAMIAAYWFALPSARWEQFEPFKGLDAIADAGNKSDAPRVLQF